MKKDRAGPGVGTRPKEIEKGILGNTPFAIYQITEVQKVKG